MTDKIELIVERVLQKLADRGIFPTTPPGKKSTPSSRYLGVFRSVDEAVAAASEAQKKFVELPLEKRKAIIANARRIFTEHVEELARMAVEETGLGRVEDKVVKNMLVITKTPGVEILQPIAFTGDDGLTLVERAPFGTIASITPCTNPSETIINNGISMIAGGNAVVFNPHPRAKNVTNYTVHLFNRAVIEEGGPENLLTSVEDPSIESAQYLMRHKGINLLVVTGGGAVVKEAMKSGKRVVAAGPGNPPVLVDETADIGRAGRDIVRGASLDNNIVCIAEKVCIVVHSVADALKEAMKRNGAIELEKYRLRQLESVILKDGKINKQWVGKCAHEILAEIGIKADYETRLVIVEVEPEHPLVQEEQLLPVLPVVRVRDVEEGMRLAKEVEHGFKHTACMHSKNVENMHRMAKLMDTSIFVKNAPSFAGLGLEGEGYTSFTIASPTGDGLTTARTFTRERRCTLSHYFHIV